MRGLMSHFFKDIEKYKNRDIRESNFWQQITGPQGVAADLLADSEPPASKGDFFEAALDSTASHKNFHQM